MRQKLPVLPETWPGRALEMSFTEPVYPIPPETPHSIRMRVAGLARQPKEAQDVVRRMADAARLNENCLRVQCRRGKKCSTQYVYCFFEQRELMRSMQEENGR